MHRLRISARVYLLAVTMAIVGWIPLPAAADPESSMPGATPAFVDPPLGFREACRRYKWLCSNLGKRARQLNTNELVALARDVNGRVNRMIAPRTDAENYGVADRWTLPANGKGDCEDYVLLKYKRLVDAGVDRKHLSMAVVLNDQNENHAVLVLRHPMGDLVLDNLSSRVERWNETGYRFLAMQSSADPTAWEIVDDDRTHGRLIALR